MTNNDKFIASTLYQSAVKEELIWRKSKNNEKDIKLSLKLLKEIKKIGYKYKYLADITNRENNDNELLDVVLKYIGKFDDEGISAELVGVVGKKNNISATKIILENFINSSEKNQHMQAAYYDNSLNKIEDKRYIDTYLQLLKNPEYAIKLPHTMLMISKWQIEEAKPYFLKYLDSKLLYLNNTTSDLIFIAIEALGNYDDYDGYIRKQLKKLLDYNDKYVIKYAENAIKKIEKRQSKIDKIK